MPKSSEKPGKFGFYFFGLAEIFVSLIVLLIAALFLFMPKIAPPNGQPMPNMMGVSMLYIFLSALLFTIGFGTFTAKRWARKIMLIFSWYGLVCGLLALLMMIFIMGPIFDTVFSSAPNMNAATITGMKVAMYAMLTFFYIILPGISLLFYQSKKTLAAVEYYDPKENWMDACPTPVFAVSLFSGLGTVILAFFLVIFGSMGPIPDSPFPFYLMLAYFFFAMIALAYIAWGFYHLDMKAWWVSVGLILLGTVAMCVIFSFYDPDTIYQQMHYSQEQLEAMKKTGFLEMFKSMSKFCWLFFIPYLAYLIFIRKYFKKAR